MHNGTLISDLQSLVTKFGSVAQGKTSGDVTRPEGQSLSGVTARETNAATPPEPIQFVSSGVDSDTLMGVSEKDRPCKSGAGMTPPLKVSGSHSRCNSDLLAIQSSPDLSSASPSAGEGYLDRICNNCGQPHGKHSHIDDACPEPYLVGPMYSTTEFFDSGKRCDMCGQAEEDHGNGWRCL